jgi:DNA-binding NarL/FixJ family response regulator
MRRSRLRVVVADDHQILREGLRELLEREGMKVVAEVADGQQAVDAVRRLKPAPNLAVLDVAMPVMNGVDAARAIAALNPRIALILLSGLDDTRYVAEAVRAGVRGFVLKGDSAEDLLRAIEEVQRGGFFVSPGTSTSFVSAVKAAARGPAQVGANSDGLSPRERQVVQLVAEGKSTKEIAQVLQISAKTAEFHRGRVMKKLAIHETAGLVRYAIRVGLVTP